MGMHVGSRGARGYQPSRGKGASWRECAKQPLAGRVWGDGLLPSAGLRVSQCWGTWQTREWGTQGSGVPRGPGCEEPGKSEGRVWGISGTRWEGRAAMWSVAPGGQGQAEAGCGGLPRGAVCFTVPRPQGPVGLTRPSVGTTQVPRLSPTPQCGAGRARAEAGAGAGQPLALGALRGSRISVAQPPAVAIVLRVLRFTNRQEAPPGIPSPRRAFLRPRCGAPGLGQGAGQWREEAARFCCVDPQASSRFEGPALRLHPHSWGPLLSPRASWAKPAACSRHSAVLSGSCLRVQPGIRGAPEPTPLETLPRSASCLLPAPRSPCPTPRRVRAHSAPPREPRGGCGAMLGAVGPGAACGVQPLSLSTPHLHGAALEGTWGC